MAVRRDFVAQQAGDGIDQATLHARGRGDELAAPRKGTAVAGSERQRHRLERLARVAFGKERRPTHGGRGAAPDQFAEKVTPRNLRELAHGRIDARHVEAAVGRLQGRDVHPLARQQRHPGRVRAQARPACAAQGQHRGARGHLPLALGYGKAQGAIRRPAQPAVAHVKLHAQTAQPVQPRAQQRRGLHVGREHAARSTYEGVHTQPLRPGAQRLGAKALQQRRNLRAARAEARGERRERLGVREVQPALACEQELAPRRGHGVEHVHGHAGLGQHLGRHEAGRAGADDGGVAGKRKRGRNERFGQCIGHGPIIPPSSGGAAFVAFVPLRRHVAHAGALPSSAQNNVPCTAPARGHAAGAGASSPSGTRTSRPSPLRNAAPTASPGTWACTAAR